MVTPSKALRFAVLTASFAAPLPAATIAPPVFQPSSGNAVAPIRVTIRSAAADAEIHVTMDGTEPTQRDTEIDSGDSVVVDHPLTLKARGWLPDGTSSASQVCVYTLRPAPGWGASFDDQSVPSFLAAGQVAKVSVSLRNIGSMPWTPGQLALVPQKAKDARTWGVSAVNLANVTPTWGVATFDFTITAPAEPGTYNFQWHMQASNGGAFGEAAPLKRISVVAPEEYQRLVASFATAPEVERTNSGRASTGASAPPKKSSATSSPAPLPLPLPPGITPGSEVARLYRELTRSPRSFRYLRTIGFDHSDAEFELIVSRQNGIFASTRIIRRDDNGKRVTPGWPGVKLALK